MKPYTIFRASLESARGIPFSSTTSIRFVPLPTSVDPISSPPFLPGRSSRRGTPVTTKASLPRPGSRGTPARSLSIPPLPATSSASAMPSRTPRTSAASPSTHNRCAVHTGSRSVPFGHQPGDGRFGRAEAKAVGSFPTVHPSAHSLAPAYLKISRKHMGFETASKDPLPLDDHGRLSRPVFPVEEGGRKLIERFLDLELSCSSPPVVKLAAGGVPFHVPSSVPQLHFQGLEVIPHRISPLPY